MSMTVRLPISGPLKINTQIGRRAPSPCRPLVRSEIVWTCTVMECFSRRPNKIRCPDELFCHKQPMPASQLGIVPRCR
jgi:hypothetical protein